MSNKKNNVSKELKASGQNAKGKQGSRTANGNDRSVTLIGILLIIIGVVWLIFYLN